MLTNEVIETLKQKYLNYLESLNLSSEIKKMLFDSFNEILMNTFNNFMEVLDNIYDGIVVVDENNRIIEANKVFLKWIRKSKEEILHKNFNTFLIKDRFFYIKSEDFIPINLKLQTFEINGKKFKRYILSNIKERVFFEEKLKNVLRLYKVLSRINELLLRAVNKEEVFNEACEIIVEEGRFDFVWIGELRGEKIIPVAWYGENKKFKEYLKNSILEIDKKLLEKLKEKLFLLEESLKNEEASFQHKISIPIFLEQNAISAVINHSDIKAILYVYYKGKIFDEEEINLLKQIAHDLGFGLVALERKNDIDYFTYFDILTSLPNRRYFFEELETSLEMQKNKDKKAALVLIDINHFNVINSTIGFWAGDYVLKEIAKKLKKILFQKDMLARVGSDEFALFLSNVSNHQEIIYRLTSVLEDFEFLFEIENRKFLITLSTGVAVFPDNGQSKETLFSAAEAALKECKEKGKGIVFYNENMKKVTLEKLQMESELVEGIKKDEFVLYYQPIVDLKNEKITMCEGLVRWKKGDEIISPGEFIPVLEKLGLIKEVGMIIMDKAFEFLARYSDLDINVSINISIKQITPSFYNEVLSMIDKYKIDPKKVILEITESVLMENMETVLKNIENLSKKGVKFEIDDFGTGYSSLAYLKKLPIQALKIDREFIKDIPNDEEDVSITKAIISMAHSLGKKVVAEGVENRKQLEFLKAQNCDYIQGYYFSKPLPENAFIEFLKNFDYKKVNNENDISND